VVMITRAGAIATAVALLCAGCATGQRETDSRAAAASFLRAMGGGDTSAACALLATNTRDALEHSDQQPCPQALKSVDISEGAITEAEVWGDRAQARSTAGTLFLVELTSGWRVSAAGCARADDGTYDCLLAA
jgi:hypothetical protein